jgi:anti-sigma factor RsiW
MSEERIAEHITVETDSFGFLVLTDEGYDDELTLDPEEIAALRRYLERNPQLGTANLEPAEKVGTANLEPPKSANLEPAENANLELAKQADETIDRTLRRAAVQSQIETNQFRRALALAIVPAMVARDPAGTTAYPGIFANGVRTVIDRIIGELEGKS